MLSKESYKLLKNFPEKVYLKDRQPIHQELKEAGYLDVNRDSGGDIQHYFYYVTDAGRAAVEEYRRTCVTQIVAWIGAGLGLFNLLKDLVENLCH